MTGTSYNGTHPARRGGHRRRAGSRRSFRSRRTRRTTTTTDRTASSAIRAAGSARTSTFSTTSSTAAIRRGATTATARYRDGEFARGRDRASGDYNAFWAARDLLPKVEQHQRRGAHGARVQRLERRARAQRPHLRSAQGPGAAARLLPPGRARRRAAARDDEQVVHALPVRRRERRRARAEGVDRPRGQRAADAAPPAATRRRARRPAGAAAAGRRSRRRTPYADYPNPEAVVRHAAPAQRRPRASACCRPSGNDDGTRDAHRQRRARRPRARRRRGVERIA